MPFTTPRTFEEERQTLEFGSAVWAHVVRYDKSDIHVAVQASVQRCQAVDFVAFGRQASSADLAMIEVKDYRHPGKKVPGHTAIAEEVAQKVAGTLAGLVAGARSGKPDFEWAKWVAGHRRRLQVYLNVEFPSLQSDEDAKAQLSILATVVEQKLAWLHKCDVVATCERLQAIPDCTVASA